MLLSDIRAMVRELWSGKRDRRLSVFGQRVYVELQRVGQGDMPRLSRMVDELAQREPWLVDARIEPNTRRLVLRPAEPWPGLDVCRRFAESLELALDSEMPLDEREHERTLPDDELYDLELQVLVLADTLALGTSLALKVLPFVPSWPFSNIYGLLFLTKHSMRLRTLLEQRLGRDRARVFIELSLTSAQALAQRPLSAMVSLSGKASALREHRARRAAFQEWKDALAGIELATQIQNVPAPRPAPLAPGPVERAKARAFKLALGALGVTAVTTRSPSRTVAAAFSALPQPALLGRELFAAELGRVLSTKGMLVLAPAALRRFDRVRILVLPVDLLVQKPLYVGDAFELRRKTREHAIRSARALFQAERPLRVQREGGVTLAPLPLLDALPDAEQQRAFEDRAGQGALVLGLAEDGEVVGLVEVRIAQHESLEELIKLARRAGLRVVLATDDVTLAEPLDVDDTIALGDGLIEGIRQLQADGEGVMLFSRGDSPGFAVADVGVSVFAGARAGGPWAAHVVCRNDRGSLETILEATRVARRVSEQSANVAMGATALGTLAAGGGRAGLSLRRAFFVLNVANLVSMINGVRKTVDLQKPARLSLDPTPWHALEVEGVLARLGVTRSGLPLDVPMRLEDMTEVEPSDGARLFAAVREELENPLSPLLALGASLSAVVGSRADAGIVALVGGINALIGGYQRYRTERSLRDLTRGVAQRARVLRGGVERSLAVGALQRGDIVLLAQGDLVPADCRILEADGFEVDTSSLTGESLPVLKSAQPSFCENMADVNSMVFAGATIAAGSASAVVVATGAQTLARRGLSSFGEPPRGGVEARLKELMSMTGPVAAFAGTLLVGTGLLRGRKLDDLVSTGVGLAVAAVPEGLPVLATAAQLAAAERLSRTGSLIKNPRAIEALGRIDTLCIDKTGTLTEGRIELELLSNGQQRERVRDGVGQLLEVLETALLTVDSKPGAVSDPLDRALVEARARLVGGARPLPAWIAYRGFSSGRAHGAALVRSDEGATLVVKGAPEQVLAACRDGKAARKRELELLAEVEQLGESGLRVVAVAARKLSSEELTAQDGARWLDEPGPLSFVGLLAFRDPLRTDTQRALDALSRAGVRVLMVTGDHASTARSVAREAGLGADPKVLVGAELAQLDDAALERALRTTRVFARVSPVQKVRIVRALSRAGRVVGMVGDGANDAAAMHAADVGVAVGLNASDAARGVADVVLSDANIARLSGAVAEGRAMWLSVRDAVSVLVGGNLGEIAFALGVGAITGSSPLHPRQLLLVNFLTDIAPSMAIALRPPDPATLAKLGSQSPEEALKTSLDRDLIARAITTAWGAGSAWTFGRLTGTKARARTIGLVGLVGTQLGQTLTTARPSRAVAYTGLGSLLALAWVVQTPGLSQLFGCRPLGPIGWLTGLSSAAVATALAPLVEVSVDRLAELAGTLRGRSVSPAAVREWIEAGSDEDTRAFASAFKMLHN